MTTYYIAPTTHATTPGNDTTGNGSSGTPWATISKAHTSASSGDTIICKAGTYTWASQTFTKSLTVQGESVPAYNPFTQAWSIASVFDGANANIAWSGSGSIVVVFQNLGFTRVTQPGAVGGIFRTFLNVRFTHCLFYDLHPVSTGISDGGVWANTNSGAVTQFDGCLFYNIIDNGGASNRALFCANENGTLTMYNNVIYNPERIVQIAAFSPKTLTCIFKNNIFYNTGTAIAFSQVSIEGLFSYTYQYNTAYNYLSVPSGSNNLTSDPLFVAPTAYDFRLRPGSPAVNAGVAL